MLGCDHVPTIKRFASRLPMSPNGLFQLRLSILDLIENQHDLARNENLELPAQNGRDKF
jgi:hypothetical protein